MQNPIIPSHSGNEIYMGLKHESNAWKKNPSIYFIHFFLNQQKEKIVDV